MTRQSVYYLVRTAGSSAGLDDVHPHMLRHSCGYYLATRASICGPCRTISAIAIRNTPCTTRVCRSAVRRFVEVIPWHDHDFINSTGLQDALTPPWRSNLF